MELYENCATTYPLLIMHAIYVARKFHWANDNDTKRKLFVESIFISNENT